MRAANGYSRGAQLDVAEQDDEDSDDQVKVEWLDLTITLLRMGKLQIQSKFNEVAWVCGSTEVVAKHQVPPYARVSGVNVALLRGMIKGRAVRFAQVGMRFGVLCQVFLHELQLWIRAGWPLILIRSWWCYLRGYQDVCVWVCGWACGWVWVGGCVCVGRGGGKGEGEGGGLGVWGWGVGVGVVCVWVGVGGVCVGVRGCVWVGVGTNQKEIAAGQHIAILFAFESHVIQTALHQLRYTQSPCKRLASCFVALASDLTHRLKASCQC